MEPVTLPERYDLLAPDGSEIRLLAANGRGSMVHCTLPAGGVSLAIRHRTVEELWYVIEGEGELWRASDGVERVDRLLPGAGLGIPTGAHFQFRNTGAGPLRFLIATLPPWPGESEAVRVKDRWPVD